MDPLDFFSEHAGLKPPTDKIIKLKSQPCPHCSRVKPLLKRVDLIGCMGCFIARCGHSSKKLALTSCNWGFVAPNRTVIYTNLPIAGVRTEPMLKGGNVYRMMYDLIMEPPPEPFLLVHFGRPTDTRNFRINSGVSSRANRLPDFLYVSGEGMISNYNARTIKSWLIRDLVDRYPSVPSKEWTPIAWAHDGLYNAQYAEKTAKLRDQYAEMYPGIFDRLPEPRSVELKILESKDVSV